MNAVAITDHGAMYGVIEFYKKALKEGIKPIMGMEAYTTNVNLKERPERGKFKNFHLLLLAKDNEGYQNLMKLNSIAHLEGYYYRPRVDRETLAKYAKGLICTSACPQGELAQALISDNYREAKNIASWFLDVFDKDYYLEIQKHGYEKDKEMHINEQKINTGILKLSRDLGIPIVATNDAHYIKKEDAIAQDALVCVATGKNISDLKRLRFIDSPTFYINSPEEVQNLFPELPEALENTVKIAQKCEITLTLDKWFFPQFPKEEGKSYDEVLEEKAWEGVKERFKTPTDEIRQRIKYELSTIQSKGYSTYFLIVSDMARWADEHEIVTNTRGSAAGSLVSYVLGIVDINPLTYDLPFERFLTPWRPSPPDIDFDIADDRREDVINYITEKYGHDKVAQICTFGRMLAKAAVRDISRVLGYPYSTGDRIAKLIPLGSQGFPMSIEKAISISSDLKALYESDSDAKKVIDLAKQVEGNARHISVHAAGIVIAPSEITDFTPVQLDPEGKRKITQYDMESLDPNISPKEAIGLLKFDLLGLRNLSILGAAIKIVKDTRGVNIDFHNLPLTNKKTYEMLSKGDTMGVFQLSGGGMTKYLKDLKPTRIEDLMAMVALYRPGPMSQIPEYIERKNNPGKVSYFDPRMKEYLGKSYGLLVYQDDVFMTAIKIAGYSWEEADKFRKAVAKKIPAEMEKQRQKFIEGAISNGVQKDRAEELFKLIEPFSGYGFNKAHAASYGMLAFRTAFMKANYPVEFMAALLTAESGDNDKVSSAVNECKRVGIKVLPPDINESDVGFKIVGDKDSLDGRAIRFGLNAIKNVGKAAIEAILEARSQRKFSTFADFLSKVDSRRVNKKVLESLIKVGGLSFFGSRAALLTSMEEVRSKVTKPKGESEGQQALFETSEASYKKTIQETKLTDVAEFSQEELQVLERQLLGFSISTRPLNIVLSPFENYISHKVYEISQNQTIGDKVKIAIVVSEVRIVVTKRGGQEMAFVRVEDETGSLDLVIFPNLFKITKDLLIVNKPLLVTGKVDNREDAVSLIADSLETKETLESKGQNLFVNIPKGTQISSLRKLKDLLIENPGSQKVSLVFEGKKDKVDLAIKVAWTENLAHQIAQILDSSIEP